MTVNNPLRCFVLGVASLAALTGAAKAQDNQRLFELEPYDLLTLTEGGTVLKLQPLDIAPRAPLGDRQPDDKLQVRLFDKPLQRYEVAWRDIAQLVLFEEMLLEDAARLVKAQRFDEAFEYYQELEAKHASFPGVAQAVETCLFQEAGYWHKRGRHAQALALLNELYRRNVRYAGLEQAVAVVADKLIEGHMAAANYTAAGSLVRELAARHPQNATAVKWRGRFTDEAAKALAEARTHREAGRWRDAHRAAADAVAWWPELEGAAEFLKDLQSRYPVLVVGITEGAIELPPLRLDTWADRRSGRLVQRLLVEPAGHSETGGQYVCPLGQLETTADGRRLSLRLHEGIRWSDGEQLASGYDVARRLVALADPANPAYRTGWADLFAAVEVGAGGQVEIDLRRPHPQPAMLLETPLVPWDDSPPARRGLAPRTIGPYLVESREENEVRYRLNPNYFALVPTQFQEVVERVYPGVDEALGALRRGRVMVVDRIRPWDTPRLSAIDNLVVEPYAFPTIHLLVPNPANPFTAQPEFRRALLYGINRHEILRERLLLGDRPEAGRVLSGPFPAGYAADRSLEPRPYDPDLMLALAGIALAEAAEAAKERGTTIDKLPTLVLAHPPTDVARLCCRAIQEQLALDGAGIAVELRELAAGRARIVDDYDLLYVEWVAMEPLADARRLLELAGLTTAGGPQWASALAGLERANDAAAARRELHRIHRLVHDEATVLPLWQLTEYLVHERALEGVGAEPVWLYQHVEQWRSAGATLARERTQESGP